MGAKKKYILNAAEIKRYVELAKDFRQKHERWFDCSRDDYRKKYEDEWRKAYVVEQDADAELRSLLKDYEGRARTRRLTIEKLRDVVESLDKRLALVSTKSDAVGTVASVDPFAQNFPSAYNGAPESTHIKLVMTRSGWAITEVWRGDVRSPSNSIHIDFTDETKKNMADRLSRIGA